MKRWLLVSLVLLAALGLLLPLSPLAAQSSASFAVNGAIFGGGGPATAASLHAWTAIGTLGAGIASPSFGIDGGFGGLGPAPTLRIFTPALMKQFVPGW